ncbi:7685_t:CDS:2 [Diversispora eburnea]|uniref:7685_t:CDS:1 n=1 Tax=Diversispora eburnea TaxID=1213867 RepID=A0A9N8WCB4_9GLOM|nr:7685_t:CDS:2 [Diversispora eburnea]
MPKKYLSRHTVPLRVPLSRRVQSLKSFRRGSATYNKSKRRNGYFRMDNTIAQQDNVDKDQDLKQGEEDLSFIEISNQEQIDLQLSEEETSNHNEENNVATSVGQSNGATIKESAPVKLNRNNYKNNMQTTQTTGTGTSPPSTSQILQPKNIEIRGTTPVDTPPPQSSLHNNGGIASVTNRYGIPISKTRIFVGDLSWKLSEKQLKDEFGRFGTVTEVIVIKDRNTGLSKGYGFVTFEEKHAASEAIKIMNGQHIDGRPIRVEAAEERPLDERYDKQKDQTQEFRRIIDYGRKDYYRRERDNLIRNDSEYRRENDNGMEKRGRDDERREYEVEYRRRDIEYYRRDGDFERRAMDTGIKRERRKHSLDSIEPNLFSPKGQSNRNFVRIKEQEYVRDREYERPHDRNANIVQDDKDEKNKNPNPIHDHHDHNTPFYQTNPSDRNADPLYNRGSRFMEKGKDKNASSRKRARSNSVNPDDSYYSRSSDIMHPEPSQATWQSSSRMLRKDYFIDGQSQDFVRKRDRIRERERYREFDRESAPRFLDRTRERQRIIDKDREIERVRKERFERERDFKIMERERELRERERELVRPRNHPRYYESEREPHRFRPPYYEYGRDVRPPYYDFNRETDFRDREHDLMNYRETNRDSYYPRPSPPPGNLTPYRVNVKPYYYEQPDHDFDNRRDNYGHHYNDIDHYAPEIHTNTSGIKHYKENPGAAGGGGTNNEVYQRGRPKSRHWEINAEKERGAKKPQINLNSVSTVDFDRARTRERRNRQWEITDDKSRETDPSQNDNVMSTSDQDRSHDHGHNESRNSWDANEEKSREIKDEHNNDSLDATSAYDLQVTRERTADNYWDMNEEKNVEQHEDNSTMNRRDNSKDNKEREEFDPGS